jgi:hypothetical protein
MMQIETRHHGCRISEWASGGHTFLVLENQSLRVSVLQSQGADLVELRYKPLDLDVLWHAPQGITPREVIPSSPRAAGALLDHAHGGWFESFPNGFFPCVYKGAELGQHGEIALLPWEASVSADAPDQVAVTFTVTARRTPYRLQRTLSLSSDAPVLRITEEISNLAEEEMHFMWGQHASFGPPFIAEGCVIEFPPCTATLPQSPGTDAQTRYARYRAGASAAWPGLLGVHGSAIAADCVPGKATRTSDSFYLGDFDAGWARVRNPALGLGVALAWDAAIFPYVWCWQNYGGEWGYPYYGRTFSLSIEPFTSPIATLAACIAGGSARRLDPGQRLTTGLTFSMVPLTRAGEQP